MPSKDVCLSVLPAPRKTTRTGVLLLGAACLVFAACGGSETPTGDTGDKPAAAGGGAAANAKTESPIVSGKTKIGPMLVESATQGYGQTQLDLGLMGFPLSISGKVYAHGIGTHAESRIKLTFEPKYKTLTGMCGVDDWVQGRGSVVFKVMDGEKALFTSPLVKGGAKAAEFSVPVEGLSGVTLVVENGDGNVESDHADWVNLELK